MGRNSEKLKLAFVGGLINIVELWRTHIKLCSAVPKYFKKFYNTFRKLVGPAKSKIVKKMKIGGEN